MQRHILILTLFLGTATFAGAQEHARTAAAIQAEIDQLQIELQKAKTAEGIPPAIGQSIRPESEQKILRQLEMPAAQPVLLDETSTFGDLLEILSANNIPATLDKAGIRDTATTFRTDTIVTYDTERDFRPANIKLKNVLKMLLEPHDLTYVVRNEMLYITTIEASKRRGNMSVRVYYVGDIAPELSPEEKSNIERILREIFNCECSQQGNTARTGGENVAGMGSIGGMGSGGFPQYYGYERRHLFLYGYLVNPYSYHYLHSRLTPPINNLRDVILNTIGAESWLEMQAGGDGSLTIHALTQSLAVRQTEEVHAQIEELLTQIRKMNTLHQAAQAGER